MSVDIDMEDLTKAGYNYDQPHEGDYIMAINKDLGFEQKFRFYRTPLLMIQKGKSLIMIFPVEA